MREIERDIDIEIEIEVDIEIEIEIEIEIGIEREGRCRKGTNGVSTNGVTAKFMCFDRGIFWVLPLTYFYLPKRARAYLFPQSVKSPYFFSGPISVDPIRPQPRQEVEGREARGRADIPPHPPGLGRGDDAVGNPQRAQIVECELLELKLLNSIFSSLSSC